MAEFSRRHPVWSVIIATDHGARNIPPIYARAARTMGSDGFHKWTRVILPASLPFLVTTRLVAGMLAVIPLYVIGLLASFFATRIIVTMAFGQSSGTYDHYFYLFLPPHDVLWSFGKVLVFAILVMLIHCYYGYNASGGPAGVGVAVGRAVRTSLVVVNVVDLLMGMAIWGTTTTVRIAG